MDLYCFDLSGAFNRVRCERLLEKLRRCGLQLNIVRCLERWLEDGTSMLVVGGTMFDSTVFVNSVFQGTVPEPQLKNILYADAAVVTRLVRFVEMVCR